MDHAREDIPQHSDVVWPVEMEVCSFCSFSIWTIASMTKERPLDPHIVLPPHTALVLYWHGGISKQ